MPLFRKRPVVIEAVQITAADFNGHTWDGSPFATAPAPEWLIAAIESGVVVPDTPNHTDYAEWRIKTLEGEMLGGPGDWIIQGVKGELYPCKPDIFAATYDAVAPEPVAVAREWRARSDESLAAVNGRLA
jgi:hypothetical protein